MSRSTCFGRNEFLDIKTFNIWNIIKVLILVLATGDIFELDQRSRINIWVMLALNKFMGSSPREIIAQFFRRKKYLEDGFFEAETWKHFVPWQLLNSEAFESLGMVPLTQSPDEKFPSSRVSQWNKQTCLRGRRDRNRRIAPAAYSKKVEWLLVEILHLVILFNKTEKKYVRASFKWSNWRIYKK